MNIAIKRGLFYAALLLLWMMIARAGIWPDYLFPSPDKVGSELLHGIKEGEYTAAMFSSIRRLLIGYVLSVFIGFPLGCAIAGSRSLRQTLGSLILGLQTLPSVCWLPIAILWFGLNDSAIIFVIVSGSVLSVSIATTTGVQQIPQIFLKVAKTTGAKGWNLYRHVIFPAVLPTVWSGLKQGWSFAWRALMSAELLFVSTGLGHLLNMGRELNNMEKVIAVILLIISIGLFADYLFSLVERRINRRWGFEP